MTQQPVINYQSLNFWFQVFQFLLTAAIGIYVWWTNREKVTNKRFSAAENRLAQLENDVKHPPACTYHPRLEERMDAVQGDTREIKGSLKGLAKAVDLINEFLINQGGKR